MKINKLSFLRSKLPEWTFTDYGKDGAVQCIPPFHSFTHEALRIAFNQLNEFAVISSTCGASGYIITQLKNP